MSESDLIEVTRPMVDHLASVRFQDLPPGAVKGAQAALLDHLGCVLFGMSQPWLESVRRAVLTDAEQRIGGARVLGTGVMATPGTAAFVNGTAAHGFELDDIYYRTHPGSVVISAVMASLAHENQDGRQFLAAITVGYEVTGRIARSIGVEHSDHGFHTMGIVGPFGSAAGVAHLRGFNADRLHDAIGLAASFGSGIKAFMHGPGMVKRLHAGQAAMNGVLAADLAGAGFLGPQRPLEGRYGFVGVFAPRDAHLSALTAGLGREYAVADVYQKPYSACGALHGVIRAAEQLRSEHHVEIDDIDSIVIGTSNHGSQKSQARPVDVMTTQYSLQAGAVLGLLGLARDPLSFRPEVVLEGEAGRVMGRIQVCIDDEAESHFPGALDSRVTIELLDGRRLSAYGVGHSQGDRNLTPEQRWTEAVRKFYRLSKSHISEDAREHVVANVRALASGGSPQELARLLA